jgi:hypothetical protein
MSRSSTGLPAHQKNLVDIGDVHHSRSELELLLEPGAEPQEDAVVPPDGAFPSVGEGPDTEVEQQRRPRLHSVDGGARHRQPSSSELGQKIPRLVAATVADQVVELGPSRRMQRCGEQDRRHRCGDARELRERGLVVVHVLDDVERRDEIERPVAEGKTRHEPDLRARAILSKPGHSRETRVDEARPLEGQPRSEARPHLQS